MKMFKHILLSLLLLVSNVGYSQEGLISNGTNLLRSGNNLISIQVFPQEADILALSPLVWWKPDESRVTKDGSNRLSQVNDISGNNNHLVQLTGAEQPLWVANSINGRPVMRFNGTDENFDITSIITIAGNYTIVMFYHNNNIINLSLTVEVVLRSTNKFFYTLGETSGSMEAETISTYNSDGDFNADYIKDDIAIGNHIFIQLLDGTTGTHRINKTDRTVFENFGGLDASDVNKRFTGVHTFGHTTATMDGDVAEFIIFDSALDADALTTVENYGLGQFGI